jgi:uncharacterized damage-inducible protein DinB
VDGMSMPTIRPAYDMWPQYNRRLREAVSTLTDEQLALGASVEIGPIWAVVGHTAGTRVYWLCDVVGEPGAETTPFANGSEEGWEDDLDHPRSADELVMALDSTFRLIEGCLDRWTPDMLADPIRREYGGSVQMHTRSSILQRILTHEAYHCGELSQALGTHGLPQIDLWRPD